MSVIRLLPRRWEYAAARDSWFSVLVAVHIAIIITIAALTSISGYHQGIATLPDSSLADSGEIWSLPLLWTSIPTLVMTLLALAASSTIHAVRDRQPFADMALHDGSTLDKTLLLDYRTTFGAFQWIRAARNGHWPLSLSLLSTIFLSVTVPPLSARLFTEQLISREVPTLLPITHRLNLSMLSYTSQLGDNPHLIDWKPLFELTNAVSLFNATPPAWSDTSFAYEHFTLPPPAPPLSPNSNPNTNLIRAPVTAYTADADCRPLHDFSAHRSAQTGFFSLRATDRGCALEIKRATLNVEPTDTNREPIVLGTYSTRRCGEAAGGSRLVVVSGRGGEGGKGAGDGARVDGVVGELGVVSCMTGYLRVPGELTLRPRRGGQAPEIVSFQPTGEPVVSTGGDARVWSLQEEFMLDVLAFNSAGRWLTTEFGNLVLYRAVASKQGLAAVLDPAAVVDLPSQDELIEALRAVLRQLHIAAVANVLMRPVEGGNDGGNDDNATTMGAVSWSEPRLVVVPWAAAVVLALLCASLFCCLWSWIYVRCHPTILTEEPAGLLGHLAVWYPTLISEYLQPVDQMMRDGFDGGPDGYAGGVSRLKEDWNTDTARCVAVNDDEGNAVLVVSGLNKRITPDGSEEDEDEH